MSGRFVWSHPKEYNFITHHCLWQMWEFQMAPIRQHIHCMRLHFQFPWSSHWLCQLEVISLSMYRPFHVWTIHIVPVTRHENTTITQNQTKSIYLVYILPIFFWFSLKYSWISNTLHVEAHNDATFNRNMKNATKRKRKERGEREREWKNKKTNERKESIFIFPIFFSIFHSKGHLCCIVT